MVTDAIFLEKEKQLVVVGEWMSPVFLQVERGGFEKKTPKIVSENGEEKSISGMWNCIEKVVDKESGKTDLLLGNMGTNSIWGNATPLELYVKDFDDNHQTDPIITYHRNGKKEVFTTRDNLTNQLSFFRKKFLTYQAFAEASFEEIFTEEMLKNAIYKKVDNLNSIYLIQNDNGSYLAENMDFELQKFPIQDFATLRDELLTFGNFYGNHPSIGKMDAGYGYSNKNRFSSYFGENGFVFKGDARRIAVLESKRLVIVALNNGQTQIFGY